LDDLNSSVNLALLSDDGTRLAQSV